MRALEPWKMNLAALDSGLPMRLQGEAARRAGEAARFLTSQVTTSDYLQDKVQDVVTLGVMSGLGGPGYGLMHPQDTLALAISLGSTGDRQSGEFGFAIYENCKGACQFMNPFLPPSGAFTPGSIGFGMGTVDPELSRHQNQHGVQSLITGLAYLPTVIIDYRVEGYPDNFIEHDAEKAEQGRLHFPDFLRP